jgi:TolB-like protein/Flp pilus assembly protein TadD
MSLFNELKRRNVFKVAAAYVIVSWLILQVVSSITPMLDLPEVFGKMVLVLLLIGLPIALLFAWAFELTPEGIKKESEVDRDKSITSQTSSKINMIIIGALVLIIGGFAYDKFFGSTTTASTVNSMPIAEVVKIDSIAVLAFEDFSAGGDQVHLGEGLADAVLHMLAQVGDLRVSARTSSFSFRGQNISVANIGKELDVAAILEGSVQRSGDTLRIIAQLIRVTDQTHIWSKTFDRPTGDIFAVQDEIASAVVAALRPAKAPSQTISAQTNLEAYEHFLRGNDLWQLRSKEGIEQAIVEFQSAIAADPKYAPAHSGLAMAYLHSTYYGNRTTNEVQLLVEQSIERALAIDADNALAYAARGQLLGDLNQWDKAEAALRHAIKLNPSDANVLVWLGNALSQDTFRQEEVIQLGKQAYLLDPRNQYVLGSYAGNLATFGDYSGALAVYRKGIILAPETPRPYADMAQLHLQFGHHDDAIRARLAQIERAPGSPEPYFYIAASFLALDDQESAQNWFKRAQELNPNQEFWPQWFLRKQDLKKMISEMQLNLTRDPENTRKKGYLCYAYLLSKQYQQVQKICGNVLAKVLGPEDAEIDFAKLGAARSLYWSARQTADSATADLLMDKMSRFVSSASNNGVVHWGFQEEVARIAAFRGDHKNVFAHLRHSVEIGSLDNRGLTMEPWWDTYREAPEFIAILKDIRSRQTKQRNALRAEGL